MLIVFWLNDYVGFAAGDEDLDDDAAIDPQHQSDTASAHGNLHRQTSNLMTKAMDDSSEAGTAQPLDTAGVKALYADISKSCKQVNSAISRQPRDRVGGRFFMPDIIEAANFEPTDPDYMSEEDTLAIYESSRSGKAARIVYGTAERLIRAGDKIKLAERKGRKGSEKGSEQRSESGDKGQQDEAKGRSLQVPSLHIEDVGGKVYVRMFELAKSPAVTSVEGRSTYVQPLLIRPGQSGQRWVEKPCADIVSVVDMQYLSQQQVWTLADYDERGMHEWLQDMLQREADAARRPQARGSQAQASQAKPQDAAVLARAVPHTNVGPKSHKAKQAQKGVRRSARLAAQ